MLLIKRLQTKKIKKIPRFTYLMWMQGTMGERLKTQLVVESAVIE
jgi:hypothetical protein